MRPTSVLAVIGFALLASHCLAADPSTQPTTAPAPYVTVDADEFQKLLTKENVVLLDVRTPAEYSAGHLADAVNINFNAKDFADRISKLDKEKTYLVYCAIGGRSAQACGKMSKLTFPNIYNLKGGIGAWKRAGKPVEQ